MVVAIMNTTQTLIMDLFPAQGSSITAAVRRFLPFHLDRNIDMASQNNLVRCTMGAALVSVINLLTNALGVGWTFVLLGGICVLASPMIVVSVRRGPAWRERRRKADAERAEKEKARTRSQSPGDGMQTPQIEEKPSVAGRESDALQEKQQVQLGSGSANLKE